MAELRGRKRRFFDEYIIDRNGRRAAIAAGYAEGSAKQRAYKLLHEDADVIAAIKEHDEELHKINTARENEVVEFLTSVMRGKDVETIPIFIGGGVQEFTEGKPSARERLKAAELLGKHYAMFTDKSVLDGEALIQIVDDIK